MEAKPNTEEKYKHRKGKEAFLKIIIINNANTKPYTQNMNCNLFPRKAKMTNFKKEEKI